MITSRAGRFLRSARRRAGLSQRALARKSGVPQPTIAAIEVGSREPRYATLERLLSACGFEWDIHRREGDGVDGTLISDQLRLAPDERIERLQHGARWLTQARPDRRPMKDAPPPLDVQRILKTLRHHDVRFVVIGGLAAQAWGSPRTTLDVDVCYERGHENITRLAAALSELGARLRGRGVPDDLPFVLDARTLELGDHFTFRTVAGDLDCLGTPAGTTGFADVAVEAQWVDLFGVRVLLVPLEALMRMKRAAGRAKDRLALEDLGALREELERRGKLDTAPPGALRPEAARRRTSAPTRRPRRPRRR